MCTESQFNARSCTERFLDVRIRGSIRRNSHREMDEMAAEIRELKTVIQVQGEMIRRILDALEGKGKQRAQGSVDGDSQDDR